MHWFMSNPVADLWGPYFLVGYVALFLIFLVFARYLQSFLDKSERLGPLLVPSNIDPYRLAYLRGGLNEVLRLFTVDLYERGVLKEEKGGFLRRRTLILVDSVDLQGLSPAMRFVAVFYAQPRQPTDVLRLKGTYEIEKLTSEWDQWIQKEQLRFSPESTAEHSTITASLAAVFLLVGLYKFAVAIAKGHDNFWILIVMMILGAMCIGSGLRPLRQLTIRGRKYIDDLQTVFSTLKKPSWNSKLDTQSIGVPSTSPNYALPVLAMGLFGISALQGSRSYAYLHSRYGQSSGCGAGCGAGASCGGGGCGGGCGGCGGCGG